MKHLLRILILLISVFYHAQKSGKWSDWFSYHQIIKVKNNENQLIVATKSGLFYYDTISGEIKKQSKVDGLHEVGITAFDYNPETQIGLIGYETGAMDLLSPEGVFLTVDIPIAGSFQGDKKINHIYIQGDLAVISTNYGVSIFDLTKREFKDSAFFQSAGVFIPVAEAFIKDDTVYAATAKGLKTHLMDIKFPIYSDWQTQNLGELTHANANAQNILIASKTKVYMGSNYQPLAQSFSEVKDVVLTEGGFLVFDVHQVYQFSEAGALVKSYEINPETLNTGLLLDGEVYIGTMNNGIVKLGRWNANNPSDIVRQAFLIKPDGPYANLATKLTLLDDQIWVATGRKIAYNAYDKKHSLGYYYFDGQQWHYPNYFVGNPIGFNILDVAVNPSQPTELYFSNYVQNANKGVFKMVNDELQRVFNTGDVYHNVPEYLGFDSQNNLLATFGFEQSDVENVGIYFIEPNANQPKVMNLVAAHQNSSCILYEEGRIFIGAPRDGGSQGGLIVYDTHKTTDVFGDDTYKVLREEEGLPTPLGVTALALDQYGDLWIGNKRGLRILTNPLGDLTNAKSKAIVITQNGIPEELFKDAEILSIAVDSGNNKWVSLAGGGVYFISADGQKVYQHFTKSNSPLPTDEVTDIKINDKTGQVFFATSKGIVAYRSDVSQVTEKFGQVLVYPNPVVYSQYKGSVKIKGLAQKTNIRITDAAGNLIHQAVSRNGYYEWNLNNEKRRRVASGIYFVLMTNEDGTDTATAKIAVVN